MRDTVLTEQERIRGALVAGLKQSERKLQRSERKFRLLYEDAPLAYQALDEDGVLLVVNQTWLDFWGYGHRDQVIGRWLGEFLAPDSVAGFEQSLVELKREGQIHGVELEIVRKDGGRLIASLELSLIHISEPTRPY